MNGIIIYKGKYGATRQYAQWLSEELGIPFSTPDELEGDKLARYDFIILGSSVYIGKLQIQKWIRQNIQFLEYKKIFLFVVSGTPPEQKQKLNEIVKNNVPAELLKNSSVYFLHGKLIMDELSTVDKFLLKMGARVQKDPRVKKEMLTDYNDVKKEHITALVNEVNKLEEATYSLV